MLSKTALFKALFALLPLAVFSASTNAADLHRVNPAATITATEEAIENAIEGSYIVLLKAPEAPEAPRDGDLTQEEITRYVEETAIDMAARYRFEVELIYSHALTGFSISAASETTVQRLTRDSRVDDVAQDSWVFLDPIESEVPPLPPSWAPPPWIPPGDFLPVDPVEPPPSGADDVNAADLPYVQYKAPWGLDRIDQRDLPLNGTYQYNTTAANVHVYVIDSGIRATHQEFGDRVLFGTNFVNDQPDGWGAWGHQFGMVDCFGHGTHVAGVIGGATYGVAKEARLVPVRVFGCEGEDKHSWILAALDWVANHVVNYNTLPAVVNMSFGAKVSWHNKKVAKAQRKAVDTLIDLGITVVASAGNENIDACEKTPSRIERVITAGATTQTDARWPSSNYGTCVNVFAPGSSIPSAWPTSDTAIALAAGTSLAAPHVAGVAALWYATDPFLTEPSIRTLMKQRATPDRLSNIGPGSPNLLLYSRWP